MTGTHITCPLLLGFVLTASAVSASANTATLDQARNEWRAALAKERAANKELGDFSDSILAGLVATEKDKACSAKVGMPYPTEKEDPRWRVRRDNGRFVYEDYYDCQSAASNIAKGHLDELLANSNAAKDEEKAAWVKYEAEEKRVEASRSPAPPRRSGPSYDPYLLGLGLGLLNQQQPTVIYPQAPPPALPPPPITCRSFNNGISVTTRCQ